MDDILLNWHEQQMIRRYPLIVAAGEAIWAGVSAIGAGGAAAAGGASAAVTEFAAAEAVTAGATAGGVAGGGSTALVAGSLAASVGGLAYSLLSPRPSMPSLTQTQDTSVATEEAAYARAEEVRKRRGAAGTILTSPLGIGGQPTTLKAQLGA